jgi:two-component system, OmpR family, sensor kinase
VTGPAVRLAASGSQRPSLNPNTWPVRWRLAGVSAGLTLAILVVFGVVLGHLVQERIQSDFDQELGDTATSFASQVRIDLTTAGPIPKANPNISDVALPSDAIVRVFDVGGKLLGSNRRTDLGPPSEGIYDVGSFRVTSAPIRNPETGFVTGLVQYARSGDHVDSTVERLWLLIAAGVFGGSLLACLAGLAIANRAMRPIASLTATARDIAETGDPSRSVPRPEVQDEVGELATTLEEMLRSLDAARAEREGAMTRQREFVADASHELRTPLTSVIANLELLQESLHERERSEEREMVDSALRSSRRMSRLVADLLLLARADAGRVSERRPCDLAEIAASAVAEVSAIVGKRTLRTENGAPIPIEGNPDELHRMVANLLENAVRHTPEGTTIELRLGRDEDTGEARLEVADDGPGIPPELRDQVFARFVRGVGPADTSGGNGTGLGLAIVQAVARSHGGSVESGTSERGGALFRVRLPRVKSEEPISAALRPL